MQDEKSLEPESMRTSAISVWHTGFAERVSRIDPAIYSMGEQELEQFFKPNPVDFFLRKRFWELSELNIKSGLKDVSIMGIYDGICTRQNFYTNIIKKDHKLCWILLPIQRHIDLIEEGLYYALKKVRDELLTMPVNEKTAGHLLKALEFFANRALGPMIQRIEQKSMNMNVDGNKMINEAISAGDLVQRYEELKSKLLTAPINQNDPE